MLANNEIVSAARQMTTLELKELNERQRAEHAHKMYEQARNSLRQVEERNTELESKFAEVWGQNKHHFQTTKTTLFSNKNLRFCVPSTTGHAPGTHFNHAVVESF